MIRGLAARQLLEELLPLLLLRGEHTAILTPGFRDVASPALHLEASGIVRILGRIPAKRHDVVHLIPEPIARRTPPAGGVKHGPADSPPSAAVERGVVAAHRVVTCDSAASRSTAPPGLVWDVSLKDRPHLEEQEIVSC